ncbi:MAG: hypothetical protein ABI600_08825 [Luteolibacter sp.]
MHTTPTPQPDKSDSANPSSGAPPWYPDYPAWLVSEACLLVIWGIMTEGTLTKIDKAEIAKFREPLDEVMLDGAELTPDFIRDMALAVNPGADDQGIKLFLRGIVETYVLHQGCDLPKSKRFLLEYPEFGTKAEWNNSAETAEIVRTYASLLLASRQEATDRESGS